MNLKTLFLLTMLALPGTALAQTGSTFVPPGQLGGGGSGGGPVTGCASSGTAILKGDGTGGCANAVGGTDYLGPTSIGGDCSFTGPSTLLCTKVNGVSFAPSATVDTTNATNISSGVLAAARGGAGTVSGILKANGSGTVSAAVSGTDFQPAIAGNTLSAHNFANHISSAGVISGAQPAASDVSGLAASATTDTTNASNISSGTLNNARLPSSVSVTSVTASSLTSGNCVQASTGGLLTTTGSSCSSGGGTTITAGAGDLSAGSTSQTGATLTSQVVNGSHITNSSIADSGLATPHPPGGTTGQVQYKSGTNTFGGYTPSGDVTVNTSTGVETVQGISAIPLTGSPASGAQEYQLNSAHTQVNYVNPPYVDPSTAVGDLYIGQGGSTTPTIVADVSSGKVLLSGGVGQAPLWGTAPTLTNNVISASNAVDGTPGGNQGVIFEDGSPSWMHNFFNATDTIADTTQNLQGTYHVAAFNLSGGHTITVPNTRSLNTNVALTTSAPGAASTSSPLVLTLGGSPATGTVIVINAVMQDSGQSSVPVPIPSGGGVASWVTAADSGTSVADYRSFIFVGTVGGSPGTSLSISWTGGTAPKLVASASVFSNVTTTVDAVNVNGNTSTASIGLGPLVTDDQNDLILGSCSHNGTDTQNPPGGIFVNSTGYTAAAPQLSSYYQVASPGSYISTCSWTTASEAVATIVAIQASSSANGSMDFPRTGLIIYSQGACNVAGTITADGVASASGSTSQSMGGGGGGGGGGTTLNPGNAGNASSWPGGANAVQIAAGGTAGSTGGANNGGPALGITKSTQEMVLAALSSVGTPGGSAGGAGGVGNTGTAGAAGSGGGMIALICASINVSGTLDASGAAGGGGGNSGTSGGGGGGGGGGGIIILASRVAPVTTGATILYGGGGGGTGGTGSTAGGNGGAGGTGWYTTIDMN